MVLNSFKIEIQNGGTNNSPLPQNWFPTKKLDPFPWICEDFQSQKNAE